jgi:membrane-associated protease RseP (regulator of RpoE activity)
MLSFFVACFLVVFSLIAHELGHWVVLRRLGVPVREWWVGMGPAILRFRTLHIGMLPIGASVYPEPEKYAALTPRQHMAVALGGPIGSAVYGLALLLAATQVAGPAGSELSGLEALAMANFAIALLNMLPIPPLDGFHILVAVLQHSGRPLSDRAKGVSYRLGNGLLYGFGFLLLAQLFV